MKQIPETLGVGHKVKTKQGKGKIVDIKGDIAKVLVGGQIFESNIKFLSHIKGSPKGSPKGSQKKTETNKGHKKENDKKIITNIYKKIRLSEHLKKLDDIDKGDYLIMFQWFFELLLKGLNCENGTKNFRTNLAENIGNSLSKKFEDPDFKIGSYCKLPQSEYDNPDISFKRILGQFLKQMERADKSEFGSVRYIKETMNTGDRICNAFLDQFNIPTPDNKKILFTETNLN